MKRDGMKRDGGFVLVNALILVAALSAVAVYLLSRAEAGRVRLDAGQQAEILALGLDAVEALALTRLDADLRRGEATDHAGEAWARRDRGLELALGTADVAIGDAQGRFNLNWLADPGDAEARAAFDRLIASLGLPPQLAAALADFVRPGGPADRAGYAAQRPPSAPVGGPAVMLPQIAGVPGMDAAAYARLVPHLAVLPGDPGLNVNTATPEVLAAFLPDVPRARLDRALAGRPLVPFATAEDFLAAVGADAAAEDGDAEDGDAAERADALRARLAVGSAWFRLDAAVTLDGRRAERQALIERPAAGQGARVAWRLTAAP